MDLRHLTQGERLLLLGGLTYVVSLCLPWYGVTVFTGLRIDNIGWDYVLGGVVPLLLVGAAMAFALAPSLRPAAIRARLPGPLRDLRRDAAAAAAVIVFVRTVVDDEGFERRYGLFVGLVAVCVVAAGALLSPVRQGAGHR